jgi:hypothetical protein
VESRDRRQEAARARHVTLEEDGWIEEEGRTETEDRIEAEGNDTEAFVMEACVNRGVGSRCMRRTLAAVVLGASFVTAGCIAGQTAPSPGQGAAPVPLPESSSGYYGVYTSGNVVLFGKLEGANGEWITLSDVHYVRSGVNPDTKQVANQLVKRNREWHQPDRSAINRQNVLVVEPVAESSKMMGLIKSAVPASTADPAP